MSSTMKVITNTKGSGDYVYVTLDGEIVHQGHSLSTFQCYELLKYYGSSFDQIEYLEMTDEELWEWEHYV